MINNCIIPINSDEEKDQVYQILIKQPNTKMIYPINSIGYKKLKCFYIIDYNIRYALNVSMAKELFPKLKILNPHEIIIKKELYED
jgi:hypothetical protein